jgi:hypothetical protein
VAVELVTQTFVPLIGDRFTAAPSLGGEPLELELVSCTESPHARPDHPAFALAFRAARGGPPDQQIFSLAHPRLGELELFLVPVGPQEYEAVVN